MDSIASTCNARCRRSTFWFGVEPVEDALLFVVGSSFEFANQLSGELLAWALRKARYERARGRFGAFIVVQHFAKSPAWLKRLFSCCGFCLCAVSYCSSAFCGWPRKRKQLPRSVRTSGLSRPSAI